MRTARIARKTNETDITLTICLDGRGVSAIQSGVGFLDHMLTLLARHGRLDLELTCRGDTQVDDHHSVEDIGIALGDAVAQALGEKRGVRRYASLHLPMDEALILCAVDCPAGGLLRCPGHPGPEDRALRHRAGVRVHERLRRPRRPHPPPAEGVRPQLPPHRGGGLQGPGPGPAGGGGH